MAAPQPAVVLPSGFFDAWASDKGGPSNDCKSRVTASGFTATQVSRQEEAEFLEQQLRSKREETKDVMQKNKELKRRKRSIVDKLKNEDVEDDDFDKLTRQLLEMSGNVLSGKKLSSESNTGTNPFSDSHETMKDFQAYASDLDNETVVPNDSISTFQPLKLTRRTKPLSAITEDTDQIASQTVIGGFKQTVEQKIEELECYSSINPIVGLPIVFTNPRLNFLTHVHSALFKIITGMDGKYPSKECADLLLSDRRNWSNDPSTQLLEIVLDKTIDTKRSVVKANPFSIPILEPTMPLTRQNVYMAFDQLHNEFETEWFNTMKTVTTPKFHSKYEDIKFGKRVNTSRSTSSGTNRRSSSSSTSSRHGSTSSKHKSGSVVGSLFGFN